MISHKIIEILVNQIGFVKNVKIKMNGTGCRPVSKIRIIYKESLKFF